MRIKPAIITGWHDEADKTKEVIYESFSGA